MIDPAELRAKLAADGRLALHIRVIPKSSRTEWSAVMGDGALKVKLAATPEKGRANDELIRFLAAELGVGRSQVEIVAGHTNTNKQVRVTK